MMSVDGRITKHGIEVSYDNRELQEWNANDNTNIGEMITILPISVRHMISGFQIPGDEGEQLVNTLLSGDLVAVCDGSVKEDIGTYGYIFSD